VITRIARFASALNGTASTDGEAPAGRAARIEATVARGGTNALRDYWNVSTRVPHN
jgi:hypothetical protein